MSSVFGLICWLSVAGSLLALILLAARRAFANKLPPSWFYYLWLIVLLRFMLPLASPLPVSSPAIPLPTEQPLSQIFQETPRQDQGTALEIAAAPATENTSAAEAASIAPPDSQPLPKSQPQPSGLPRISVMGMLSVIWLSGAALFLLYSAVCYLMFRRALRHTSREIDQPEILRLYQQSGDFLKLKKLPPLLVSAAVRTPMQVGLVHPVLLLPQSMVQQPYQNLSYFLLHELVHYRRRDVLYKWLIQLCACLHWFNPLVYIMKRELQTLCELSCDAYVLSALQPQERQNYGQVLLKALETAVNAKPAPLYGVSWNTEVKTMKARLKHIMSYEKQKKPLMLLMIALTVMLAACGIAGGPAGSAAGDGEKEPATATLVAAEPVLKVEDKLIQWQEPAIEALVRERLGKPSGDIWQSELDGIWGIELFGDTHLYFNGQDGGYALEYVPNINTDMSAWEKVNLNWHNWQRDSEGNLLRDGTYTVGGTQYARGSISSIADLANFRNLQYLYVYKNDLRDLTGLEPLAKLCILGLQDNNIQDIGALAQMKQWLSINLSWNRIEDLTPLANLNLGVLNLTANEIADLRPLANLGKIEQLNVSNNQITSLQGLESLNVQGLSLSYNPLNSLEELRSLNDLFYLYLDGIAVDDISILANKSELWMLGLANLKSDSLDLAKLTKMLPQLHSLEIGQNQAELLNFRSLAELKELRELYATPNINIPDTEIEWLRTQLPYCSFEKFTAK